MTTAVHQQESVSKLNHEYSTSWKIEKVNRLGSKSIKTPTFSPIPNSDAAFYFELWYQCSGYEYDEKTHLKIIFSKSSGANVPKSIKLNVILTIYGASSKSTPLKRFENNNVNVDKMDLAEISNIFEKRYIYNSLGKKHLRNRSYFSLTGYSDIIIKCQLMFYGHLCSPTDYLRERRLLKNLKQFATDFDDIYQHNLLDDINFKIGNELLPATKSILAAHSPVLRRMISSDFSESETNTVVINDSTPEVFKCFLKYLYSAEVEDKTWPMVKELFRLADKYDVGTLKSECGEILASFLSVENACEILKIAYDYGDDDLKNEANLFASQHFQEITTKDEWKEIIKFYPLIIYDVMMRFAPKSS